MAKQRQTLPRSASKSEAGPRARARGGPATRPTAAPGISPITIALVAVVVAAFAGFAIFYNQQRAAAPATAARPVQVTQAGMTPSGIPAGFTEEGYAYKGDPNAKVVIEGFSDYQCPHCGSFALTVEPRIDEEFVKTGRARFVFRDFQFLDRNPDGRANVDGESHRAAIAAQCAGEQGQFWAMHDTIFHNQPSKYNAGGYSDANLEKFAGEIGLNLDQFRGCMSGRASEFKGLITRSMNDSLGKQVQGTPTFFVNGRKVESGDYETLKAAIELAEQAK